MPVYLQPAQEGSTGCTLLPPPKHQVLQGKTPRCDAFQEGEWDSFALSPLPIVPVVVFLGTQAKVVLPIPTSGAHGGRRLLDHVGGMFAIDRGTCAFHPA